MGMIYVADTYILRQSLGTKMRKSNTLSWEWAADKNKLHLTKQHEVTAGTALCLHLNGFLPSGE